jgi:hypothetical protein
MYVPICGTAVVETLLGTPDRLVDAADFLDGLPDQELQPHQRGYVARAREAWEISASR